MSKDSIEFEGKTTEDAIKSACAHFSATPDNLDIEILSTGSTGIFGLVGSKKARVKASLKKEEIPVTGETESVDEHQTDEILAIPQEIHEDEEYPISEPEEAIDTQDDRKFAEAAEEGVEPPATADVGDALEVAKETLEKIISYFDLGSKVTGIQEGNTITLTVEGESTGILIGKKGKTLDAVQFLVSKVVNKNSSKKLKLFIDTENYRQRHQKSLEELAMRLGEKVKRTGKPVTISPMNPADRRVVHLALQNDKSLRTRSKGEGLLKKIVILPQRNSSEARPNSSV